ncbi:MAG TPA: acetamidase/formamidase family protein [Hyphomicrobiaceae bacterium]|nr:acetamidase/formamidase family protein [Hyphomicrobiaceae bacterium]
MTTSAERTSIDVIPVRSRAQAWALALQPLHLGFACEDPVFRDGAVALLRSSTGARLALLRSCAQSLFALAASGAPAETLPLTIALQIAGRGRIVSAGRAVEFADGDLCMLDMQHAWTMSLRDDFEILALQLPRRRLFNRLGRTPLQLPVVLGASATAAAARPILRSLATHFDTIKPEELASAETAVVELVASSLLIEARAQADHVTQVQSANFRRVTAEVEALLDDPELSLITLAERVGLSRRYLQRLFERHNQTLSDYVRNRRLERCRSDLLDRAHADKSIRDIAFRWGFRDQAHFSRAFSAAFGASPRSLRKLIDVPSEGPKTRGRPLVRPGSPPRRPAAKQPRAAEPVRSDGPQVDASEARAEPSGNSHYLAATAKTVHWGYLSRSIPPVLRVGPDAHVTIETLTQHAYDDYDRMIAGDPGAESVFRWTAKEKSVDRRGAGPLDASVFGRGAGEGFGVHICTGPIHVEGAQPGDVLAVEILDIKPRPSANPLYAGKCFASNAAAWWGYQYHDMLERPLKREVVTIFEVDADMSAGARALYSFRWTPQRDPFGTLHPTIDYPGIPVDHKIIEKRHDVLPGVTIPLRPHFGFIGVAPREADIVDSIPPGYFGGNIDNWRCGPGSKLYLPVAVPGALFSVGDGHLAQGDGEINGTGLECSLTGNFHLTLIKAGDARLPFAHGLTSPVLETPDAWVLQSFSYANYLKELGKNAQAEIYSRSSLDLALRGAFRTTRKFLVEQYGLTEDDAITLMSLAVDFGITQVADGNWGVHAVVRKQVFAPAATSGKTAGR